MIFHLLLLLSAAPCAAQNSSEPQYQLTGKNYQEEAAALQQMLYNNAGAVKSLNVRVAALSGAITASGANTFTSTNTFNGPVVFNSSATFNGGVFGTLYRSSCTAVTRNATGLAATTFTTAVSGSTLTFVSNGKHVCVSVVATCRATGAESEVGLGCLVDSAFCEGQSATVGMTGLRTESGGAASFECMGHTWRTRSAVAAGSHIWSITTRSSAGNFEFATSNANTASTADICYADCD